MEKALILLSGGLDSLVASKLLQEQLELEAVHFLLPFCKSKEEDIKRFCKKEKIKLHLVDATKGKLLEEYLSMLRNPKHGRGAALNPCIDCHLFLLRKSKELASNLKISVIATGEVLGERPLSQTRRALEIIDNKLDFPVLRPLSARLLEETEYENKNLVDRTLLLDIKGRNRKKQLELANHYKISFPTPGGGCLLCEKEYCKKLNLVLDKNLNYNDIKLLSIGRHFPGIILGRDQKENELLETQKGIKVTPNQPGPTALIKDKNQDLVEEAKKLIRKYSKQQITSFEILN